MTVSIWKSLAQRFKKVGVASSRVISQLISWLLCCITASEGKAATAERVFRKISEIRQEEIYISEIIIFQAGAQVLLSFGDAIYLRSSPVNWKSLWEASRLPWSHTLHYYRTTIEEIRCRETLFVEKLKVSCHGLKFVDLPRKSWPTLARATSELLF